MIYVLGILGGAVLFVLLTYSATRSGSRLEESEGCQGDSCALDSCSIHGGCQGCGGEKSSTGWWPGEHATYGDR